MVSNSNRNKNGFLLFVELSLLGMEMVIPIAFGVFFDSIFNTKPTGVILGMIFGVTCVVFHIKKRLF